MPPIINGLIFGLIFLFAIGPAFFALIQTSIQQGLKKAIFLAVGISLSDVLYVTIVLLGMAKALETDDVKFWIGIFGVVMLMVYGVYSWLKPVKVHTDSTPTNDSSSARQLVKGFFLNGLNPFIVVSWVTWVSAVAINFDYQFNQQLQFFGGMLIMILSMDVGKAFVAHRLKHLVNERFVKRMNRTVAVILVFFSFQIIYFLITNY
ncbi:MAG: LysE family transporter [Ekhidna sp.]|nr:LysE family transporter [Ekhidna sp.]